MEATEAEVIDRLVRWAGGEPQVRALLLTSSRANPNAPRDALSDYDIVVVASDADRLAGDDAWLRAAYGAPMVRVWSSYPRGGIDVRTCLVLHEDGTKIDYSLWSVSFLAAVCREPGLPDVLDVGYRVLVDKDGLTAGLKPPAYKAHIPREPSEAEFVTLVEEFWLETAYVAKNLRRDELLPAKYSLDAVIKFSMLRRMLEWHAEIEHDWSLKTGFMGRGLKGMLKPEVWAELESTFVGPGAEENWEALFGTVALFRKAARTVAARLGYRYPDHLDRNMTAYLNSVRSEEWGSQRQ